MATFLSRDVRIAPANRHMVLRNERIFLEAGAKHLRVRPAVDPFFELAAKVYGWCV